MKEFSPMKHLTIFLSIFMLALSPVVMAQEDDMYFIGKKDKKETTSKSDKDKTVHKVEIVFEEEPSAPVQSSRITATAPTTATRDVDEYNRRGRKPATSASTSTTDTVVADTRTAVTYELSSQSLYDLGYDEGYSQGFTDAERMDYYYGLRLARFHGCHYYDPWYWNRVSYVYDPWFWDPWYYDPWYRPYYYGGWYSVGWGVGYWGSYWNPYYPYPPHYYHHHHHWGPGHHAHNHGPRYSTSRNQDYGRTRIVDRSRRVGDNDRYVARDSRTPSANRSDNRRYDRSTRFNDRVSSRADRVTDRSTDRNSNRSSRMDRTRRTNEDRSSSTRNRSVNRSNSRSSSSSSSRIGSSSSSFRNSGTGSRSGGGVRSGGSSRGGRGR